MADTSAKSSTSSPARHPEGAAKSSARHPAAVRIDKQEVARLAQARLNEIANTGALNVAEVRRALHSVRSAWYETMDPNTPFLFSATALVSARRSTPCGEERAPSEEGMPTRPATAPTPAIISAPPSSYTVGEFACVFDYGQHVKRHHRLVPTNSSMAKLM
jgi:hypothetical protein